MALDNFIPKNDMAQCNKCKKFRKETLTCALYQKWIPREKPVGKCLNFEPMKDEKED